jgi:hypothetical protein
MVVRNGCVKTVEEKNNDTVEDVEYEEITKIVRIGYRNKKAPNWGFLFIKVLNKYKTNTVLHH